MELTEQDKKMIDDLRKERDYWPQVRWIMVGCSILISIILFTGLVDTEIMLFAFLILQPLVYSLAKWNGRPEISLLLKLIENQTEDKNLLKG